MEMGVEAKPETIAEENAKLLIGLCRAGLFYEIEQSPSDYYFTAAASSTSKLRSDPTPERPF